MPALLNNELFPLGYEPWYVYNATINAVRKIDKFDVLVADGTTGRFVQNSAAGDLDLTDGYVIALEQRDAGTATGRMQVLLPGSLTPAITHSANTKPAIPVKATRDATHGVLVQEASAADIAAGRCIGRLRGPLEDYLNIRTTSAARSLVAVQTGLI